MNTISSQQSSFFQFPKMTFVTQAQSGDGEELESNLREQKGTQKQEHFSVFSDKKRTKIFKSLSTKTFNSNSTTRYAKQHHSDLGL
jgi:hypothetical protein